LAKIKNMGILKKEGGIYAKKEGGIYANSIRLTYRNRFGGIEVIHFDELFDLINFIKEAERVNKYNEFIKSIDKAN
jgi:hypothetical protein